MTLISLVFLGTQNIFAQTIDDSLVNKVDFILENSRLVDDSGNSALQIKGKVTRTLDEEINLILSGGTQKIFLCAFVKGTGKSFSISYPECIGGRTSTLKSGINYSVYFSDDGDSMDAISEVKNLGTMPEKVVENSETSNLSIVSSIIKKSGAKNYYEIKVSISEKGEGSLVFSIQKNGEIDWHIIGSTENIIGNFTVPKPAQLAQITSLTPGEYKLRITDNKGNIVKSLELPAFGVNSADNANPVDAGLSGFEYNETQKEILKGGLVKSDCGYNLGKDKGGRICGFSDLMGLIGRVIEYIFVLVLPIAAIVFAYAGFLFMTSGGDSGKRTAAKTAMTKLVIGIVVIMMAWLLVKLILTTLGVTAGFTMFLDLRN